MSGLVAFADRFVGDPRRARDLAFAGLIIVLTAYLGLTIPTRFPIVAGALLLGAVVIMMIESQEKTLYLVLWFSTVYLTLKATVLGWSEAAFLLKDGFLLLLLAFWVFNFLIRQETLRRTEISKPLAILTGWLLVQCFNPNTYGVVSILQDLRFWLIPLAIHLLTVQLVDNRVKLERALKVVFTYATVETLYGIAQQGMHGDTLVKLGANPDSYFYFYQGTIRSFSTMGTVQFALFAMMFPTLSFFYMSQQRNQLRKAFFFCLGFAFCLGVVFTLVRTAWVSLTIALTVYAIITRRHKILLVMGAILLILVVTASGYMRWKLEGVLNPSEDASVQTRIQIAQLVTEGIVFRAFGYGLGTFAHNRHGMGFSDKTGYGTATESWYLMVALELGWIGMGILAWIWYKIYRFAWEGYRGLKTNRYRELSIALAGSLFALEIARLGGPSGYFPPESWHYWFFVGLLMTVPKADAELDAEIRAREAANRAGESLEPAALMPPNASRAGGLATPW